MMGNIYGKRFSSVSSVTFDVRFSVHNYKWRAAAVAFSKIIQAAFLEYFKQDFQKDQWLKQFYSPPVLRDLWYPEISQLFLAVDEVQDITNEIYPGIW